jgi:prolyl oligopeptidase
MSARTVTALFFATATITSAGCATAPTRTGGGPVDAPAPESRRDAVEETRFGVTLQDPYRWLEDPKSPDTVAWVAAQDAHTRAGLDALPHRDALEARFAELFYLDAVSVPWRRGENRFYTRRTKEREKAVIHWKAGADGPEQVLIDPNTLSADGSTSVGGWVPTWDGKLVAWKVKENNADEATIRVRDVASGQDLPDRLDGAKYASPAWTPDNSGFYYVHLPSGPDIAVADRPGYAEIRWHALGTAQSADPLVFPRTGDPKTFVSVDLSRDGRFLFVGVQYGWSANDVYVRDLTRNPGLVVPQGAVAGGAAQDGDDTKARFHREALALGFTPIAYRKDALTTVTAHDGVFYALTNENAPQYKVFRVAPDRLDPKDWVELIPEGEGPIEDLVKTRAGFVVHRLAGASSKLELWSLDGVRQGDVPTGVGTITELSAHPDDSEIYYSFSSFTQPSETFRADLARFGTAPEKYFQLQVPFDPSKYVMERVTYASKDGTPISMFLAYRKGLKRDGSHATLLYGYGGFNVNLTPTFAGSIAVWLELGGVYAMPNLRGGGEYGEAWHRAGMRQNKQNVFDDFHAAAEWLVKEGFTAPSRLAIRGGSNGGLLVGAAMTQRPELYRAVICAVPLLDMVRYHLFGSGMTWIPEYGNADLEGDFPFIHAYSPYHQVRAGVRYPSLLMMGADSDDRVDPLHARKFTALLQWARGTTSSGRHALFRLERNAGHGGGDMVKKNIENYTDQWAWLAHELGLDLAAFAKAQGARKAAATAP